MALLALLRNTITQSKDFLKNLGNHAMNEQLTRVLVVEENKKDFLFIRNLLTDIHHTQFYVQWTSTYTDALKPEYIDKYDIYLVESKLGIPLMHEAHRSGYCIPIIILDDEENYESDLKTMRAGALDYLVKKKITASLLERSIRYSLRRFHIYKNFQTSEKSYTELVKMINESILVFDNNQKIIDCNKSFTELFGFKLGEIKGRKITMLCKRRDDYRKVCTLLKEKLFQTSLTLERIEFQRKNNSLFLADVILYPLLDKRYKKQGFIGLVRNVTEKGKAEIKESQCEKEQEARERAEKAKKQLKFLADASVIFTSSLDYKKTLANVAKLIVPYMADWCSVDMLGEDGKMHNIVIAHSNPKRLKWGILFREQYPPNPTDHYGVYNVVRTGKSEMYPTFDSLPLPQSITKKQLVLMKRVGIHSEMIVPLCGRDRIFGTLSFINSDPKSTFTKDDLIVAEELGRRAGCAIDNALLYEQANEGIRVRDEFLNIVSHELKTPLTSLQLQIQILFKMLSSMTKDQNSTFTELLLSSERQIKKLSYLINNLLDVSRSRVRNHESDFEEIDLTTLLTDVISRFVDQAATFGSTIHLQTDGTITGRWNRSGINQVVTNLLSNAIKYGLGNPIHVITEKKGNYVYLHVIDRGIGIQEKKLEKIFERFERSEEAKKFGGLGLGLFIAKRIVDAHKGEIRVKSEVGKGSHFTVVLPIHGKISTPKYGQSVQTEGALLVSPSRYPTERYQ